MSNRFLVGKGGWKRGTGGARRGGGGTGDGAPVVLHALPLPLVWYLCLPLSVLYRNVVRGTPRRLAKITGLCWDRPACLLVCARWRLCAPVLGLSIHRRPAHLLCAAVTWSLSPGRLPLCLSEKHTHAKKHTLTLLDIKMGPLWPKRTTSFIYVQPPRGWHTSDRLLEWCSRNHLPLLSSLAPLSQFLMFVRRHVLRWSPAHVSTQYALCRQRRRGGRGIIMNSFFFYYYYDFFFFFVDVV